MKEMPLEYLIRPAKITQQEKSPAIFMIHGYGSNKEDLFSFANELPDEYVIFSLQAPYPMSDFGYAWYAIDLSPEKWFDIVQAKSSQRQILSFIEQACEDYNLDRKRISILGFSQGCILGLSLALSYPDKIQAVIGLSGYVEQKMLISTFSQNNFSNLKLYISHGTSDQIIPIEWSRETPKFLDKLSIKYIYEEYPVGHTVSPQCFYSFRDWIRKNC